MNLSATKGSGGTPTTAYLTATKLVPRKKTARSREASVNNSALPLRSVTARILRPDHPRRSRTLQTAWEVLRPTGNHVGSGNPQEPIPVNGLLFSTEESRSSLEEARDRRT